MKMIKQVLKSSTNAVAFGISLSLLFNWILTLTLPNSPEEQANAVFFMINPFSFGIASGNELTNMSFALINWILLFLFFSVLLPWIFKNKTYGLLFSTLIGFFITWLSFLAISSLNLYQFTGYERIPVFRFVVLIPTIEIIFVFIFIWIASFFYYRIQIKKLNQKIISKASSTHSSEM
ncbi:MULTISPECIES: DUF3021 family protein [unclassified Lactococcus]|uniref:DUF3021 family protein n=1 Tax=unclassified Lactococcus TaxID=2643510 RepID=UPI0011CC415E|nr:MULTISPECIES: DUF3021 family protein [unclassified Lactococcus]MQW22796.1 DUF3021 family protein [Lactococcus sp. dk101]TXK44800.1 DUF3021 family protein [Lactococcus sp. dk310]TXK50694.1 DUF3021 family protein [Lactococcus sp. dk322]